MKIRQAAAWRAGISSAGGHSSLSSSSIFLQELALTRMLIGIAVLFIVCVFPNALFRFVWLFVPEMNIGRRYHNFYLSGLWILETLTYVNSSLSIFCVLHYRVPLQRDVFGVVRKKQAELSKKNNKKKPKECDNGNNCMRKEICYLEKKKKKKEKNITDYLAVWHDSCSP